MEDRNKELPLVVSEILIEMHEMKDDMREVKNALHQMASFMSKQQQHNNDMFRVLMDENRKNTEMMVNAFREEATETRNQLNNHEGRLSKLESK